MCVTVVVQAVLFGGTVLLGGTITQLDQNALELFQERVSGRRNYLQNEMILRWSNVSGTAVSVAASIEQVVADRGRIVEELATDSSLSVAALDEVSDRLVSMLRRNGVTGAFVLLEGAVSDAGDVRHPALYLRDMDPLSNPEGVSDLLVERGSSDLIKRLNIPMDANWYPQFLVDARDKSTRRMIYDAPFQAALANPDASVEDLAYWSLPYCLQQDDLQVIAYSMPLMGSDGRPIGVIGVEVTLDYLRRQLPYDELLADKSGVYVLAMQPQEGGPFTRIASSGPLYGQMLGSADTLALTEDNRLESLYQLRTDQPELVCANVQYLSLYSPNTPFEGQRWALIGLAEDSVLTAFSHRLSITLLWTFLAALGVSILIAVVASRRVARPVITLARQVRSSDPEQPIQFTQSNVQELDDLALAIESLSRDVAESASRLSQIIEMTSRAIGAFEYRRGTDHVLYTRGFFSVLCRSDLGDGEHGHMDVGTFRQYMSELKLAKDMALSGSQQIVFKVLEPDGKNRYVRLKLAEDEVRVLGLVEDITSEVMEKQKLAYERDYDILTNLLNRRAFHATLTELFTQPEQLKCAALVMMDLDNLKYINDTYGHDYGDQYIRYTADILRKSTPRGTLLSRMSGDEFYVFFHGYSRREDIRRLIDQLKAAVHEAILPLPDDDSFHMRASAGVAWYPEDAQDYEQLIRFADFAMYTVKHTTKGEFSEFNMADYEKDAYLLHKKEELNKLIDQRLVDYHFQPIVSTATGEVFAYEALMRSKMDSLKTPLEILSLAKSQSLLYQIERLTWFEALKDFAGFGRVVQDCRLFINSIANQFLLPGDLTILERQYGHMLSHVVVEVTESEQPSDEMNQRKQRAVTHWHASVALDDFGTGYNSETMLLRLNPQFVKMDMSIVRGVDKDERRLKLLQNMISYAKERGIKVIAEGVEHRSEMAVLIENGVDYLQGYYVGRPSPVPQQPSASVREEIRAIYARTKRWERPE